MSGASVAVEHDRAAARLLGRMPRLIASAQDLEEGLRRSAELVADAARADVAAIRLGSVGSPAIVHRRHPIGDASVDTLPTRLIVPLNLAGPSTRRADGCAPASPTVLGRCRRPRRSVRRPDRPRSRQRPPLRRASGPTRGAQPTRRSQRGCRGARRPRRRRGANRPARGRPRGGRARRRLDARPAR